MASNSGDQAKDLAAKLKASKEVFLKKLAQLTTQSDSIDSPVIPDLGSPMTNTSDPGMSTEQSPVQPMDSNDDPEADIEIASAMVKRIKAELDKSLELFTQCLTTRSPIGYEDIQKHLKRCGSLIEGLNAAYEAECSNMDEGV